MLRTLALLVALPTATPLPTGSLKGQVVDAQTQTPLEGVTVSVPGADLSAVTDREGRYAIADVPVGSCNVVFRKEGRPELVRPDLLVRSARSTYANAEMSPPLRRQEEVTVADYFEDAERGAAVAHDLGAQELVRTAPGGDLSRALFVLPGVVQVDDGSNDLVVRGGSPTENGYYVDNIPIPNINHFPQEGPPAAASTC
jgi:hypothetical protein